MSRELNKIFDAKTREARRRILDKFDISNEDKNEVLNKIEEGGNGDGEAPIIEYYKVNHDELSDDDRFNILEKFAGLIKIKSVSDETTTMSILYIGQGCELLSMPAVVDNSVVAVAGFNVPTSSGVNGEPLHNSWLDAAKAFYSYITDWSWLTPITKEEFYNLEVTAPIIINFTIDTRNHCEAEEGMTFEQWVNSSYNTIGAYIEDNKIYLSSTRRIIASLNKTIENGEAYDVAIVDDDGDADFN